MHNLIANSHISLILTYTDSIGESLKCEGTGIINGNSFIKPNLPKHQIQISGVNFPDLGISNATFRIQPQYDIMYLSCSQLSDTAAEPITNININVNIDEEPIVSSPINSNFIGTDIARLDSIPKTTSQLDNDSGFITSNALNGYATETWVGQQGYLTSVAWGDITDKPTLVTTDTEQEITGKKILKSTNPYYWAEIGVIDGKDVPGISFKDNYSKVNIYRDSNDGYMKIETPTYGTPVQIKNVLIEGKGDGSDIIRSVSTSNKLHLGDATRPISNLYAKNLSDGTTTKTMTEVLEGSTKKKYRHIIRAKSSVAPTSIYCFEWISDKSTAYTYSEVDELVSEFETAGLTSIDNPLPCI